MITGVLLLSHKQVFPTLLRNETVIYQSQLTSLKDMVTKQSHTRYCVPITQQLVITARLVQGNKFKITSANKVGIL